MRDFHRRNKLHPKDVQSKLQDYRRISTENKVSCALKKTSALFLINYRSFPQVAMLTWKNSPIIWVSPSSFCAAKSTGSGYQKRLDENCWTFLNSQHSPKIRLTSSPQKAPHSQMLSHVFTKDHDISKESLNLSAFTKKAQSSIIYIAYCQAFLFEARLVKWAFLLNKLYGNI